MSLKAEQGWRRQMKESMNLKKDQQILCNQKNREEKKIKE